MASSTPVIVVIAAITASIELRAGPDLQAIVDRVMVRAFSRRTEACVRPATVAAETDPDAAVIALIANGDGRGCEMLMQRHLRALHALACRLLGNAADADEICQDAFVRAWRQAPQWQPGNARFSTWLHQVTLNLCRDRLRRRHPHEPIEALEAVAAGADPADRHASADRARHVRAAVAALPERQREALVLCHFQGLGNIEAASVLELSVDALESLLARARRSLRLSLAGLADAAIRGSS